MLVSGGVRGRKSTVSTPPLSVFFAAGPGGGDPCQSPRLLPALERLT